MLEAIFIDYHVFRPLVSALGNLAFYRQVNE